MFAGTATQLAQTRPSVTTAVPLYAPEVQRPVEITRMMIVSGATGGTLDVFQDADGTTRDGTTIIGRYALPPNTTLELTGAHLGGGITIDPAGEIAIQASVADELTVTIWGIVAPMTQQGGIKWPS